MESWKVLHRQCLRLIDRMNILVLGPLGRRERQPAGKPPGKRHDGAEHEQRVEDVQGPLVLERVAGLAHGVLDDAEDGAHKDEDTAGVQHDHEALPLAAVAREALRGALAQPRVENGRHDEEQAEHDDLDDQAAKDDVLAHLQVVVANDHEAGAAGLDDEGEDVAADEDGRQPLDGDHGEVLRVHAADDAAERHVDGRGEQRGGDEDEGALDNVGHELVGLVHGRSSGTVSYDLNYSRVIQGLVFALGTFLVVGPSNHLQKPPMMKTVQNHVLVLKVFQVM